MTDAPLPAKLQAKQGSRWALVPVGLLASSVVGLSWMALVAVRDPNFALERDYYQKALHWDQTQAQAADNQRFAYQFSAPPGVTLDKGGHGTIQLKLNDRNGHPVSGARVVAEAFPNAFSDETSQLTFSEHEPGVYSAQVKAGRAGLWELRLSMDNGPDHATAVVRCDLTPGGAA
jgi:hypothetical protein